MARARRLLDPWRVLTSGERHIALAIVDGLSNPQIARVRDTSVSTVANQVARIYLKLSVADRTSLRRALQSHRPPNDEWRAFLQRVDPPLSSRQEEALALAASGCSHKTIAQNLGVSSSSINTHLRRAARKLGCANARDAVAYFLGFAK